MTLVDSAVAPYSAARLTTGNDLAPAEGPVSASGFGSDFISAVPVGIEGSGTDAAGLGGRKCFGSSAYSALELPVTGGAVAYAVA